MNQPRPKRIGFIASTLNLGGAERQLFYIVKDLKLHNAEPIILCMTRGEYWQQQIEKLGVPVLWVGRSRSRILRLFSIIKAISENNIDTIHSQHFHTNIYAVIAGFFLRKKVIGSLRSDVYSEIRNTGIFGKACFFWPKILAANSKAAIKNAIELGKKENQLFFLPNVVDESEFIPRQRTADGRVMVAFVGNLRPAKRVERILQIAKKCQEQMPDAQIEFRIYGDGRLNSSLQQTAEDLGVLNKNVFFLGKTNDPLGAYQAADIFLLTSDHEGTPNVILEAMSCGLPILTTDIGDVQELVEDGINGFVSQSGDESGLFTNFLNLAEDRALREKMGKTNREFILHERSFSALHDHVQRLFELT